MSKAFFLILTVFLTASLPSAVFAQATEARAQSSATASAKKAAWLDAPARAGDDDEENEESASAVYQIELKQISPGVWQADYNFADNAGVAGWTLSEKSSVILRHTPQ